ncbi:MAG: hypothetical protein MJ240_05720 [Kiritimatiellae bacterium]|nr:hypothetical protein [Kiritimatiellia bacterium]
MSGHVGMDSINRQAFDRLSSSFGQFVADEHMKGSTIVKTGTGLNALRAGSGDFRGNIFFRSASQIEENNAVRNAFLKSVSDVYGGQDHIPESVRKAMKESDFDGKGHPLTARRIRATMDAIRMDIDHKKIADAVETLEWCGDKDIKKLSRKDPAAVDALHQYTDKLADDFLDAMKATILPDVQKGKVPSAAKLLDFMELLGQADKPETAELFPSDTLEKDEAVQIRQSCRVGALAKAFARDEGMIKLIFSNSKDSAAMARNFASAYDEYALLYEKGDKEVGRRKTEQVSCCQLLATIRSFMVAGMSPEAISSLLVKMADEQAGPQPEEAKGNLTLSRVIDAVGQHPDARARGALYGFLRQIGQSVLDGTLRPRKPGCDDALYLTGVVRLYEMIGDCARNRETNAKAGNHDAQPESIMGSAELDAQVKQLLREIRNENTKIRVAAGWGH